MHSTGRSLAETEWTSGSNPFVNDWITDPSVFASVMREMREEIFADHVVTSIRRKLDGSIRRVNRWVGRGLQRRTIIEDLN